MVSRRKFLHNGALALIGLPSLISSCYQSEDYPYPPIAEPIIPESGKPHKRSPLDISIVMHGDEFVSISFDVLKYLGITTIRTPARWMDAELTKGNFDFSIIKNLVDLSSDFDKLLIICDPPEWAADPRGDNWTNPPKNPEDIYDFAYNLALNLIGKNIKAYQTFSEQNAHGDQTDLNQYGWGFMPWEYLLTQAFTSHAIRRADPNAMVILGGNANADAVYQKNFYDSNLLTQRYINNPDSEFSSEELALLGNIPAYANGLINLYGHDFDIRKTYDKVAVHIYLGWNDPDTKMTTCYGPRWYQNEILYSDMDSIDCISRMMHEYNDVESNGKPKKIWITETGFSTMEPGYNYPNSHEGINEDIDGRHLSEYLAGLHTARFLERLSTEEKFWRVEEINIFELQDYGEKPVGIYGDNWMYERECGFGLAHNFYMENFESISSIPSSFFKPSFGVVKNFISVQNSQ